MIPVIMLVRDGAAIPRIAVAQSTKIEVDVFAATAQQATGLIALPDGALTPTRLTRRGATYTFASDPLAGKVAWTIRRMGDLRSKNAGHQ